MSLELHPISIGSTHAAAATQPDLEAVQPQSEVTERTRLLGSSSLGAAQAATTHYFDSIKLNFRNLSTKEKLCLALGIGGVVILTLSATYAFSKDSNNPPSPQTCWEPPDNATEICNNAMATFGNKYLKWMSQAPNITALTSMQNGIRQLFCNGTKVIDPATIAWAQNIIPQLSNAIANQTAIALTGEPAPYDPFDLSCWDTQISCKLYDLVFHANFDFKEMDQRGWGKTNNWFGMENYWAPRWIELYPQSISLNLMQQGATMALKQFCDRWNFSDIVFNNGTYTCVQKQFADYIPVFARWCFWRS
ncbi:MAG: hypothetical protein LLG04_17605 [Parachlamydia sp.]|nr:hypothetical protein [Parachlamydia sp.]